MGMANDAITMMQHIPESSGNKSSSLSCLRIRHESPISPQVFEIRPNITTPFFTNGELNASPP